MSTYQVSKHFHRDEFRCKDQCNSVIICRKLVDMLQAVRDHFGVPVAIISGTRCTAHNKAVGGAPNSYHLKGMAADIRVANTKAQDVFRFLDENYGDVIGLYQISATNVHVDCRGHSWRKS